MVRGSFTDARERVPPGTAETSGTTVTGFFIVLVVLEVLIVPGLTWLGKS